MVRKVGVCYTLGRVIGILERAMDSETSSMA